MEFNKEMHEKIEQGEEVECLENECDGIIKKISDIPMEQFSELDESNIINYVCSKNPEHKWEYEHTLFEII